MTTVLWIAYASTFIIALAVWVRAFRSLKTRQAQELADMHARHDRERQSFADYRANMLAYINRPHSSGTPDRQKPKALDRKHMAKRSRRINRQ